MIRLCQLHRKHVRREGGEKLGRVYEIHIEKARVTMLICGASGFLQRLTDASSGHRIPWEQVLRITDKEIVIANKRG